MYNPEKCIDFSFGIKKMKYPAAVKSLLLKAHLSWNEVYQKQVLIVHRASSLKQKESPPPLFFHAASQQDPRAREPRQPRHCRRREKPATATLLFRLRDHTCARAHTRVRTRTLEGLVTAVQGKFSCCGGGKPTVARGRTSLQSAPVHTFRCTRPALSLRARRSLPASMLAGQGSCPPNTPIHTKCTEASSPPVTAF